MYQTLSNLPKPKSQPLPDAEYSKEWPQEKSFKLVKKFNDPRFGDISVVKNSSNQVLFVKEKMASSKIEITDDIIYLKNRYEMNHSHLLKLAGFSSIVNKELCSTTYNTKAFYEFPRTDMLKELMDRQKSGEVFNHSELAHMTYQLLSALQTVHQRNFAHGDIRPQLIGFDKTRNHFELLDRLADTTPVERCQTNHLVNNKDLFMSPQLYKRLKGKDKSTTFDAQKNDIFALGLSILYLGNGENFKDIYLPSGEIEHRKLQEHVMNFDLKYNDLNPVLCAILKELLRLEEDKRNNVTQIIRSFPTYEQYKRDEASGKLVPVREPRQAPKVQSQPKPPVQQYVPPQQDFFADVGNHRVEEPPQYKFPVAENEDFDGHNSYMVKTNQVNSQPQQYPPQQYTTQQYNQNFNNVSTTTYVRSTPQELHTYGQVQYQQPTITYVQHQPNYTQTRYVQSNPHYVHSSPENLPNNTNVYFDDNGYKVIRRSYQGAPVELRRSVNEQPVEVRRGSNQPTAPETKVIKKRYVMREDGTVVEIDPNADVNEAEIRKYFDNNYTKNTIAEYDNVNQALGSQH